jgi:alkane 1-monooxygenase
MDKRVLALYGGDLSKINVDPRKRAKVEAKYGHLGPAATGESPMATSA